ncbi:MAG: hypothetical protein JW938_04915, partial [Candidatus Omnitrophica bacterium]|nr:hypothetical protein [Candidatus Omnitrophota bacterium]
MNMGTNNTKVGLAHKPPEENPWPQDQGITWRSSTWLRRWFQATSIATIFFFMFTLIDWRFTNNTVSAQEAPPPAETEQEDDQQAEKSVDDETVRDLPHLAEMFQVDVTGPLSPLTEIKDEVPDSKTLEDRIEFADESEEDEDGNVHHKFRDPINNEIVEEVVTNGFGNVLSYTKYETVSGKDIAITMNYNEVDGQWDGKIEYESTDEDGNKETAVQDTVTGITTVETRDTDDNLTERQIIAADGSTTTQTPRDGETSLELDENDEVYNGVEVDPEGNTYTFEDGEIIEIERTDGSLVTQYEDNPIEIGDNGEVITGTVMALDGTVSHYWQRTEVVTTSDICDAVSMFFVAGAEIVIGELVFTDTGYEAIVQAGDLEFTFEARDGVMLLNGVSLEGIAQAMSELRDLFGDAQVSLLRISYNSDVPSWDDPDILLWSGYVVQFKAAETTIAYRFDDSTAFGVMSPIVLDAIQKTIAAIVQDPDYNSGASLDLVDISVFTYADGGVEEGNYLVRFKQGEAEYDAKYNSETQEATLVRTPSTENTIQRLEYNLEDEGVPLNERTYPGAIRWVGNVGTIKDTLGRVIWRFVGEGVGRRQTIVEAVQYRYPYRRVGAVLSITYWDKDGYVLQHLEGDDIYAGKQSRMPDGTTRRTVYRKDAQGNDTDIVEEIVETTVKNGRYVSIKYFEPDGETLKYAIVGPDVTSVDGDEDSPIEFYDDDDGEKSGEIKSANFLDSRGNVVQKIRDGYSYSYTIDYGTLLYKYEMYHNTTLFIEMLLLEDGYKVYFSRDDEGETKKIIKFETPNGIVVECIYKVDETIGEETDEIDYFLVNGDKAIYYEELPDGQKRIDRVEVQQGNEVIAIAEYVYASETSTERIAIEEWAMKQEPTDLNGDGITEDSEYLLEKDFIKRRLNYADGLLTEIFNFEKGSVDHSESITYTYFEGTDQYQSIVVESAAHGRTLAVSYELHTVTNDAGTQYDTTDDYEEQKSRIDTTIVGTGINQKLYDYVYTVDEEEKEITTIIDPSGAETGAPVEYTGFTLSVAEMTRAALDVDCFGAMAKGAEVIDYALNNNVISEENIAGRRFDLPNYVILENGARFYFDEALSVLPGEYVAGYPEIDLSEWGDDVTVEYDEEYPDRISTVEYPDGSQLVFVYDENDPLAVVSLQEIVDGELVREYMYSDGVIQSVVTANGDKFFYIGGVLQRYVAADGMTVFFETYGESGQVRIRSFTIPEQGTFVCSYASDISDELIMLEQLVETGTDRYGFKANIVNDEITRIELPGGITAYYNETGDGVEYFEDDEGLRYYFESYAEGGEQRLSEIRDQDENVVATYTYDEVTNRLTFVQYGDFAIEYETIDIIDDNGTRDDETDDITLHADRIKTVTVNEEVYEYTYRDAESLVITEITVNELTYKMEATLGSFGTYNHRIKEVILPDGQSFKVSYYATQADSVDLLAIVLPFSNIANKEINVEYETYLAVDENGEQVEMQRVHKVGDGTYIYKTDDEGRETDIIDYVALSGGLKMYFDEYTDANGQIQQRIREVIDENGAVYMEYHYRMDDPGALEYSELVAEGDKYQGMKVYYEQRTDVSMYFNKENVNIVDYIVFADGVKAEYNLSGKIEYFELESGIKIFQESYSKKTSFGSSTRQRIGVMMMPDGTRYTFTYSRDEEKGGETNVIDSIKTEDGTTYSYERYTHVLNNNGTPDDPEDDLVTIHYRIYQVQGSDGTVYAIGYTAEDSTDIASITIGDTVYTYEEYVNEINVEGSRLQSITSSSGVLEYTYMMNELVSELRRDDGTTVYYELYKDDGELKSRPYQIVSATGEELGRYEYQFDSSHPIKFSYHNPETSESVVIDYEEYTNSDGDKEFRVAAVSLNSDMYTYEYEIDEESEAETNIVAQILSAEGQVLDEDTITAMETRMNEILNTSPDDPDSFIYENYYYEFDPGTVRPKHIDSNYSDYDIARLNATEYVEGVRFYVKDEAGHDTDEILYILMDNGDKVYYETVELIDGTEVQRIAAIETPKMNQTVIQRIIGDSVISIKTVDERGDVVNSIVATGVTDPDGDPDKAISYFAGWHSKAGNIRSADVIDRFGVKTAEIRPGQFDLLEEMMHDMEQLSRLRAMLNLLKSLKELDKLTGDKEDDEEDDDDSSFGNEGNERADALNEALGGFDFALMDQVERFNEMYSLDALLGYIDENEELAYRLAEGEIQEIIDGEGRRVLFESYVNADDELMQRVEEIIGENGEVIAHYNYYDGTNLIQSIEFNDGTIAEYELYTEDGVQKSRLHFIRNSAGEVLRTYYYRGDTNLIERVVTSAGMTILYENYINADNEMDTRIFQIVDVNGNVFATYNYIEGTDLIESVTYADGWIAYYETYTDGNGKLKSRLHQIVDENGDVVATYEYHEGTDLINEVTYADGTVAQYEMYTDTDGKQKTRVSKVIDSSGNTVATYSYQEGTNIIERVTYADGSVAYYETYDDGSG